MTARPRVLVIAEAANPEWVSVPLIGWSMTEALREVADVHMVTHIRNRGAILRQGWVEGEDFTVIDNERIARPLYRLGEMLRGGRGAGWTTSMAVQSIAYPYFERLIWKQFGKAIRAGQFDLVHRVTPLTPTAPSPIVRHCRRANVPFVLGPLNGGLPWPAQFREARHKEKEWLSYVRDFYKLLPYYRSTRRDAAAILVASRATEDQLRRAARGRQIYIPENAIDPTCFPQAPTRNYKRPLRGVFIGRLVPYKGPDMLLEAAAPLLRDGTLELDFLGDGPMMQSLCEMTKSEAIGHAVHMRGWVPHEQIHQYLANADLLPFPSIREFGGGAVLEAMTAGVVPLVVDYGGPAELVSDATGFKIPLGSREQIVAGLREQLEKLVADPSILESYSRMAVEDVHRRFTWPARAQQMLEVYRYVMGERPDQPVFPAPPARQLQPA
ncbi:MAG: glycosyltransferase family 4 protein [Phycisphaeraceae bacterium]